MPIAKLQRSPTRAASRGEYVYASVRAGILSGELEPGEPVREEAVAEYFEVSRTPVREALLRLETEGLLEIGAAHGGMVVTRVTLQESLETYVVREAVEGLVARLVATNATAAELDELELLHRAMERVGDDDASRLAGLHDDFHGVMYRATRNKLLYETARHLRETLGRFRAATLASAERRREHLAEHAALLDAIRRRDSDGAEALARKQIQRAREVGLDMLARSAG